jgi:hypothetical protein
MSDLIIEILGGVSIFLLLSYGVNHLKKKKTTYANLKKENFFYTLKEIDEIVDKSTQYVRKINKDEHTPNTYIHKSKSIFIHDNSDQENNKGSSNDLKSLRIGGKTKKNKK